MKPLSAIAVFALSLASVGCGGVQHCKDAAPPDTTACYEFSNLSTGLQGIGLSASLATLCAVISAESEAGECPAEGRVGGCSGNEQDAYDYIEWTYDASEAIACGSDEVRVDGNGDPASAEPGVCSDAAGAAINVTFQNVSGGPITIYWSDEACAQREYHRLEAGQAATQATFVGHAWVARAGTGDPAGGILWERLMTTADDGGTIDVP